MAALFDADPDLELDLLAPDAPLAGPPPRWRRRPWWRRRPRWLAAPPRRCAVLGRWRWLLAAALALCAAVRLLRGLPLLADPLPPHSGPYAVGALDVELPLPRPRAVVPDGPVLPADARRPAFVLESVLFTLYYPVDPAAAPPNRARTYPWIDRPLAATAAGYARLARLDVAPVRALVAVGLWAVAGALRIAAAVNAPLLQAGARLPVVVFSHGMGASRTDYTHFAGELASRGHVVAAVEHRDGSCPGSVVKRPGAPDRLVVHFGARHLDPRPDTPALKRAQLAFRDAELLETMRALRDLDAGAGPANARGPGGAALAAWRGRLDLSRRLVVAGHSYGATGALQAVAAAGAAGIPVAGAIVLDPGKESGPLDARIAVPLLAVHSESWSRRRSLFYSRPHFDTVRDLVVAVAARSRAAWFLTSLGTAHPSVSDAPLIQPLIMRWATGASLDARAALREYVAVSDAFLDFLATRNASGLLAEPVTHREYGEWVSEDRKRQFPDHLARLWEVHVSPVSEKR